MTLAALILTAATLITMVLYERACAFGFNTLAAFIASPVIWIIVCFAIFHGGQQKPVDGRVPSDRSGNGTVTHPIDRGTVPWRRFAPINANLGGWNAGTSGAASSSDHH